MNKNQKSFAPESSFSLDKNMSEEKICRAHSTGDFLVAKVLLWNSQEEHLYVYLGNDFYGIIPIEEITIYPIKQSSYFSVGSTIYTLVGKTICVCVKSISDETIILSRKENMLKAFEYLKNNNEKIIFAQVTGIENYGLFLDVGCGITGLIPYKELTASKISNPKDVDFHLKQYLYTKIQKIDEEKYHLSLTYKSLCQNLTSTLNENDIIVATCLSQLNEEGYFGYINPNTAAIIDVPYGFKIGYGEKLVCRVKKPNNATEKAKLDFITFAFD